MHDIRDMEKMATKDLEDLSFDKRTGNDGAGYYIRTFTGGKLYWKDVESHDYQIEDIAHALAMKCRWSGHTRKFYSIAQHSVFVSKFVPYTQHLEGLVHDGAEAYMPDFPSPLKWFLLETGFDALKKIEKRVQSSIEKKFRLQPDHKIVKVADSSALSTEHRDLMPPGGEADWMGEPDEATLEPVGPEVAERMFLDRYEEIIKLRSIPKWEDMR